MPLNEVSVAPCHGLFDEPLAISLCHGNACNDGKLMPLPLDIVVIEITSVYLHLVLSLLPIFADVHQKEVLLLVEALVPSQDALELALHIQVSAVGNARVQH